MNLRITTLLALVFIVNACSQMQPTAEEIIDQTIMAYGGEKVYNSLIEFDFRDKHYTARYENQRFSLKRSFTDSTGTIIDELNNDGFTRLRNDSLVSLDEEWTGKYSRSVNSVIYFFRIPFVLNDPAVIPSYLGETKINDTVYYKLGVKFTEEGGGEDYDDSFIYWVNKENYFIDYLAYSYSTDGGGKRFRKAINPREVNGLRVVDYINYEPQDLTVPIENYEDYFENGGLTELSRIINENVSINYLN
jgi:hypothetical protein